MNRIASAVTLIVACGVAACEPVSPMDAAEAQPKPAPNPAAIALPEAFDSTGCGFHGAVYAAHSEWTGRRGEFRYRLTVAPPGENRFLYEARLIFEARDPTTGALATTLRLEHTTGNNLSRHAALTDRDEVVVDVQHLNRNLGFESQGEVARRRIPAPYALHFSDLERELYYQPKGWEPLMAYVTFHTPARAQPMFPNMWVLQTCGPG